MPRVTPAARAPQGLLHNVALRRFFYNTRYVLAVVALVPLAIFMKPGRLPVALAVSLVGQAIQTWCLSSLVKNLELTIRGPYLLVRNPMYLGRYFLLLGFVLLLGNVWAALVYTALYSTYMFARVKREERRLGRNFGEDFAKYCREVRRFLPSLAPIGRRDVWVFERELFFANHAHWNILGTVAAYAALYAYHRLGWPG